MPDILQVTDPGCCGIRQVDEDGCCVTCGRDFYDPDTGEEVGDGTRVAMPLSVAPRWTCWRRQKKRWPLWATWILGLCNS